MATTIGLGVQFTANANGMTKGLSDADRAIKNLAQQASSAARLFDAFASSSAAAAQTQQQVATDVAFLGSAFRTGQISAEQYAAELRGIVASANGAAQAFAEGAQVTERVATAEEKRASTLARLAQLLEQGAISQQTYERAAADASGANESAAKAESARAQALARAAQITQANLSPAQKYDQEVQELNQHLQSGRISQETYNSALGKAQQSFAKAEAAAKKYDAAADAAGTGNTLAFNELSGILAGLPGPIGNVAGRISGLASAGEGLGRVFSGGLSQGFSGIANSLAGLVNPFTAATAAAATFTAGATFVANGLIDLEGRVEKLGQLADKLGASFEFVQVLETAASRAGTSVDGLGTAFNKTLKSIAEARSGSKDAVEAFAALGISIDELENSTPEEVFKAASDALLAMDDPAQRAAAAMALFGKSGADILPTLKQLGPAAQDLTRFGATLSDLDRRNLDELGDGFDDLVLAFQGISQSLILPFAGLAEGISEGLSAAIAGLNAVIAPLGDIVAPFATAIGVVIEVVGNSVAIIGTLIGTALQPAAAVFQILGQVVEFFADGIRAAYDAMNSVLQPLREFFSFDEQVASFSEGLEWLGSVFERLARIVAQAVQNVINYVSQLVQKVLEVPVLGTVLVKFSELVAAAFQKIQETLAALKDGVEFFLGSAEDLVGVEQQVQDIAAGINGLPSEPPEGFENWQAALDGAKGSLGKAIEESAAFGQAGFDAALQFQTALQNLQAQAEAGILNETAFQQEVDKATAAYRSQIDTIKEAAAEEERKAEAARRSAEAAIEADKKRADSFIASQRLGGEDKATKAAEDLLAITRQIDETEVAIAEARAAGDAEAEAAALRRFRVLEQAEARAKEVLQVGFSSEDARKAIEDVSRSFEDVLSFDNFVIAPDAFREAQSQLDELQSQLESGVIDPEQFRVAADDIRNGFGDALEKAKEINSLNEKYAEKAADIERDRLDALARRSNEALTGNDLRSTAGASQFLALASGREDPAVEEYRKQLRELQDIKREIAKANAAPVEIAG